MAKKSKKSSPSKKDKIDKTASNYKSSFKQKLVSDAMSGGDNVKSTKYYVAYNRELNTFFEGNLSKVAKLLGSNPKTIKDRYDKQTYKNLKGFEIYRFENPEGFVKFKKHIVKPDKESSKKKEKPKEKKPSYTIISDKSKDVKSSKFGVEKNSFSLKFENGLDVKDLDIMIADLLDRVVKEQKLTENDYIRIVILDDNLDMSMGGVVSTPLIKIKNFTPKNLFNVLEKISTSDEAWEITSDSVFVVESVRNFTGMGNKDGFTGDKNDYAHFKRSVITIKNDDDMCMARAIVTGISLLVDKPNVIEPNKKIGRVGNDAYHRWRYISGGRNLQTELATELHSLCGVDMEGGCGLVEASIFNEYLFDKYGFQICIFDLAGKRVVYPDINDPTYEPVERECCIYLLYNNDLKHYDLINSYKMSGFMEKTNFCHYCKSFYRRENEHSCKFKCSVCCEKVCDSIDYFHNCKLNKERPKFAYECKNCCRFFATKCCYDNHLKINYKKNGDEIKSVCDRIWKCHKCHKTITDDSEDRKKTHICGQFNCSNCKRDVMPGHKCYMMPKPILKPSDKYIFFDFESDISGQCHTVMYSVSAYFDDPVDKYIIHHNIDEFCKWVFREEHKDYTLLAHNGKGYDFQFILKWIIQNIISSDPPQLIKAGSKIMCMMVPKFNIRFIDSMNFVAGALASFPSIFGIKELAKGYFPHWFNTIDNWSYDGVMPPYEMFRAHNFKDEKKKEFDKWYCFQKLKNYRWIQHNEMRKYCISDVNILQKGMLKFRELFLKVANIDPLRYITIAGVCMTIYRHYYIDPTFPERHIKLLEDLEGENNSDIKKEIKSKFQEETNENVFESKLFGCYDYELIQKIRPAFFGGRTNAVKLIHNFKNHYEKNDKGQNVKVYDEVGRYADITSLYPTVQFYDKYPIGHPEIYGAKYINKFYNKVMISIKKKRYFGFINCAVNPPKNLYHPVLPHKTDKLVFDLRSKEGTWATNELYKAIDMGYEITKITEIIHYKETTTDLFKGYVSKFLKLKEEASGYPDHISKYEGKISDEAYDKLKDKHIKDYYDRMGILLDKENIIRNDGMRAIAKLCLNSLWGKFGQRINLGHSVIVSQKEQFFKIIENKQHTNIQFTELNENCMEVSYEIKDEFVNNDYSTNIGVAAFTTSSARLRLYQGLEYLNRQVLYFDTDSIVYKYNPNDSLCDRELVLGDYLGDWTDECDGFEMCGTFASGGPKNYTYRLNGKEIKGIDNNLVKYKKKIYDEYDYKIKVKGLNLHYSAKLAVNYHSVVNSIIDKYEKGITDGAIPIQFDMLKRDKFCNIINNMMVKNYQVVYTKRNVLSSDEDGNIDTTPFGWEN